MEHHTNIDDLSRMINEGFKTTITTEDIAEVKQEMQAMEDRLTTRLDRMDHLSPGQDGPPGLEVNIMH